MLVRRDTATSIVGKTSFQKVRKYITSEIVFCILFFIGKFILSEMGVSDEGNWKLSVVSASAYWLSQWSGVDAKAIAATDGRGYQGPGFDGLWHPRPSIAKATLELRKPTAKAKSK